MVDIISAWLAQAGSAHTRRAYSTSLRLFEEQMDTTWTTATAATITAYRRKLQDAGCKPATVQMRLAALSSLYEFALGAGVSGIIVNPCRNLRQRTRVRRYQSAHPLTEAQARALLAACDVETLSGARDYALMLTFLLSGWRSIEALRLRWGDLEIVTVQAADGTLSELCFAMWSGKGDKHGSEIFAMEAFDSISSYLKLAGRWQPDATAYIWQPLRSHGCANLKHVTAPLAGDRHISSAQANRILRKLLTRSGMTAAQASQYSIHDLRHTFAHICAQNGVDPYRLQQLLHHEKLTTTILYITSLERAVDDSASRLVASRLGVAPADRSLRPVTRANVSRR